jgi:membrane associated rhomboid family serine protease
VDSEVIIRVAADPHRADNWSFVLEALAIPHRVLDTAMGRAIVVDSLVAQKASAALMENDREAAEAVVEEPPAPDSGPSSVGVAVAIGLMAFFFVTGPRGATHWFEAGSATAELIVRGAWWRAVTALTLHADLAHVAGNAAALIIFVSALGRWLGRGVALSLVLFSGFAGNLLNAYAHGAHHNSIGASTAAFGALGILGGLQFVRRYRFTARMDRRRRALTAIAACLGLFAMLGVGERAEIDVLAHLAGLGAGLVTGAVAGLLLRRPVRPLAQWLLVAASAAVVAGCWWRALG